MSFTIFYFLIDNFPVIPNNFSSLHSGISKYQLTLYNNQEYQGHYRVGKK
jgi:hypothetical protein